MGKLKVKKSKLSSYSQLLDLHIDEFTARIISEVAAILDISAGSDQNDHTSIERALRQYHGIDAHLRSEYRRIKTRYLAGVSLFDKYEAECLNFARKELPSKATEKAIKLHVYEANGEQIHKLRNECDELEQKMKFLGGMITNAEKTLSAIQSFSNLVKSEREVSYTG